MAKILVAPLGTGRSERSTDTGYRSYKTATYRFEEDGSEYQSSFIASVLSQRLDLDGIIFVGTVRSMWEEVYRYFSEAKGQAPEENYYVQLDDAIHKLNYQSSTNSLDLQPIRDILGGRSDCIVINYGLNQAELWKNLDLLINALKTLNEGDEIFIDITHSFRSISLLLFLAMTFIGDLQAHRNIKIGGVFYGMVDAIGDLGYAPVVDLKPLFEITQWLKAGYSLRSNGSAYLIAELLNSSNQNELAQVLTDLSKALDLNHLGSIRQLASNARERLRTAESAGAFRYIRDPLDDFAAQFANTQQRRSVYELSIAKWYFENQRYGAGYVALTEAIETYVSEISGLSRESKEDTERLKQYIRDRQDQELCRIYREINKIRNSIAHPLSVSLPTSLRTTVARAMEYHRRVKTIFNSGTLG